MYSSDVRKLHNICVRTRYQWNRFPMGSLYGMVCYEIEFGVYEKLAKM